MENCIFIYTRGRPQCALGAAGRPSWKTSWRPLCGGAGAGVLGPPRAWRDDTRVVISILLCLIYGGAGVITPARSCSRTYFTRYNNFIAAPAHSMVSLLAIVPGQLSSSGHWSRADISFSTHLVTILLWSGFHETIHSVGFQPYKQTIYLHT